MGILRTLTKYAVLSVALLRIIIQTMAGTARYFLGSSKPRPNYSSTLPNVPYRSARYAMVKGKSSNNKAGPPTGSAVKHVKVMQTLHAKYKLEDRVMIDGVELIIKGVSLGRILSTDAEKRDAVYYLVYPENSWYAEENLGIIVETPSVADDDDDDDDDWEDDDRPEYYRS